MSPGSFDSIAAVLLIPNVSAALLAVLPGYRLPARLNVVASINLPNAPGPNRVRPADFSLAIAAA